MQKGKITKIAFYATERAKEKTAKYISQKTGAKHGSTILDPLQRIEKGSKDRSPTLNTLLRYLDAIGCELTITNK